MSKETTEEETVNPAKKLLVFLSYASEDKNKVQRLCKRLKKAGFDPWLDKERLLPGQDWNLEIEKAQRSSDAILLCFSKRSVKKEGYVHREYKRAIKFQEEKPEGTIFIIPVRLDGCELPSYIQELQWVDYPEQYDRLTMALHLRQSKNYSNLAQLEETSTEYQSNKPISNTKSKLGQLRGSKKISPDFFNSTWAVILGISGLVLIGCFVLLLLNPGFVTGNLIDFFITSTASLSPDGTSEQATQAPNPLPTDRPTDNPVSAEPPAAPYKIGTDWQTNCISTTNWHPYLAGDTITSSEPCYNLVDWGIAANNGSLSINKSGFRSNTALEYGILTDIRGKTKFSFSVRAIELSASEIWLGFLEGDTPKSDGIVVVIQHDDNIDVRPLPKGVEFIDNMHFRLAAGNYESIQVEFEGATIRVVVDNIEVLEHPINIVPTTLFLGYRALPNTEIEAVIYNVEDE